MTFLHTSSLDYQDGLSETEIQDAKHAISNMLKTMIYLIDRMSEIKPLFSSPLSGEDWRSLNTLRSSEVSKEYLPLAIITSYITELLKSKDKESNNTISSCFTIIWRHVLLWKDGTISVDLSKMKKQAQMTFTNEPFLYLDKFCLSDRLIIKHLIQFSDE